MTEKSVTKEFTKYVSQNVFAMIGMSAYILADTFFISKAVGANGITALNLVLPIYNLIYAIGAMIGVGSAIRFSIDKNSKKSGDGYFFNAMLFTALIGAAFMLAGIFASDKIMAFLGASDEIIAVGAPYTKIFMLFSPLFMWNYVFNAFTRNDKAPSVAMAATVISSLFNIVMDWVLMFPLGMGMAGAALATALSPAVGCIICIFHFASKKNTVLFKPCAPSFKKLFSSAKLGVSAFVGELSSGVITVAFNVVILRLAGNTGVAAYAITANISLVATAVFNGIAQGSQPLVSRYYATARRSALQRLYKLGISTALIFAAVIICVICVFARQIAGIFNSENMSLLTAYAVKGLRIYFIGFAFAGLNIFMSSAFSSMGKAAPAFVISTLRGFVLILASVFILSDILGMTGVWLAFPITEALTFAVTVIFFVKTNKQRS